ncbi:unnamed protein product [Ectocarpus sp. CCAP 1310/34]|nr:unnamed protein product [Ectocarpus sp. CCAP 1310/34]
MILNVAAGRLFSSTFVSISCLATAARRTSATHLSYGQSVFTGTVHAGRRCAGCLCVYIYAFVLDL